MRDDLLFRRFWGEGTRSSDAYFVIDSYEDVRLRNNFRRTEDQLQVIEKGFVPGEVIHGSFSPQAAAMLAAFFSRHGARVPQIVSDIEIGLNRDATLISYGTSDCNLTTGYIEAWSGSNLCRLVLGDHGEPAFRLGGQLYSRERRNGLSYDRAVVLRLLNRENPAYSHIVCSGLSEWGNLAAVHYLTHHWKEFQRRFDGFGGRRDFCVLIELAQGQFKEARELACSVCWEPREESARRLDWATADRYQSELPW